MPCCAVNWCISRSDLHNKNNGVSFHIFPQEPSRKELWTKAVRLERQQNEWNPSKNTKICSIHFRNVDYYTSKKGNKMLQKNAVPICTMVCSINKSEQSTSFETLQSSLTPTKVHVKEPSKMLPLASSLRFESLQKENAVIDISNPEITSKSGNRHLGSNPQPPASQVGLHHCTTEVFKEDTIAEQDIKNEPCSDKETDIEMVTVKEECNDESYTVTPNLSYEIAAEDHPSSTITVNIEDPLLKPRRQQSVRLPEPSSSTQPPKKRLRSDSSIDLTFTEDDLQDINRRLTAIEESRIEADKELARAMNRQASALEELLGLARSFVNMYERNNKQDRNSSNTKEESI